MLALSQVEGHPSDSILTRSPCSEPNFGCINCVRYSQISDGTPANLLICGLWKFFTIEQISWNHVKRESLFKERKKLEGIKLFSCLDSKKYLLTPLDHFYSDRGAFDYRVMGFGDTLNFRGRDVLLSAPYDIFLSFYVVVESVFIHCRKISSLKPAVDGPSLLNLRIQVLREESMRNLWSEIDLARFAYS